MWTWGHGARPLHMGTGSKGRKFMVNSDFNNETHIISVLRNHYSDRRVIQTTAETCNMILKTRLRLEKVLTQGRTYHFSTTFSQRKLLISFARGRQQ